MLPQASGGPRAGSVEIGFGVAVQLVVGEGFKTLKGDLAIRPVFHQDEKRIEAHIFVAFLAFLAYRLQITLTRWLHGLARASRPAAHCKRLARRGRDMKPVVRSPRESSNGRTAVAGAPIGARERHVHRRRVPLRQHRVKGRAVTVAGDKDRNVFEEAAGMLGPRDAWPYRLACAPDGESPTGVP